MYTKIIGITYVLIVAQGCFIRVCLVRRTFFSLSDPRQFQFGRCKILRITFRKVLLQKGVVFFDPLLVLRIHRVIVLYYILAAVFYVISAIHYVILLFVEEYCVFVCVFDFQKWSYDYYRTSKYNLKQALVSHFTYIRD